jgi:hypothetical protein
MSCRPPKGSLRGPRQVKQEILTRKKKKKKKIKKKKKGNKKHEAGMVLHT